MPIGLEAVGDPGPECAWARSYCAAMLKVHGPWMVPPSSSLTPSMLIHFVAFKGHRYIGRADTHRVWGRGLARAT